MRINKNAISPEVKRVGTKLDSEKLSLRHFWGTSKSEMIFRDRQEPLSNLTNLFSELFSQPLKPDLSFIRSHLLCIGLCSHLK